MSVSISNRLKKSNELVKLCKELESAIKNQDKFSVSVLVSRIERMGLRVEPLVEVPLKWSMEVQGV